MIWTGTNSKYLTVQPTCPIALQFPVALMTENTQRVGGGHSRQSAAQFAAVLTLPERGPSVMVWAVYFSIFPVFAVIFTTNKQTNRIPNNERVYGISTPKGKSLRHLPVWRPILKQVAPQHDAATCQGTYRRWHVNEYGALVDSYWQVTDLLRTETCLNVTLSTTNPTCSGLGSNLLLCDEGPATDRLSLGTAVQFHRTVIEISSNVHPPSDESSCLTSPLLCKLTAVL